MGKKIKSERQLVDSFLKDCMIRGMTKRSVDSYKSPVKAFISHLQKNNILISQVNRDTLREYLSFLRSDRGLKQKTIENHFSALSSFFEYLVWEHKIEKNMILEVRKRYLRTYKKNSDGENKRRAITVEEMSRLINSILDIRDKAIAIVLAKTGIRREELVKIDISDIDWSSYSIKLKPMAKRTNRIVFFDGECAMVLRRWMKLREEYENVDSKALFLGMGGRRLKRSGVYNAIRKWATKVGLFNESSEELSDRFSVHFFRHWFTTHLLKNGMPREYVQELRGDIRKDAVDIYDHIDLEDLRKKYLASIPQLNVY